MFVAGVSLSMYKVYRNLHSKLKRTFNTQGNDFCNKGLEHETDSKGTSSERINVVADSIASTQVVPN